MRCIHRILKQIWIRTMFDLCLYFRLHLRLSILVHATPEGNNLVRHARCTHQRQKICNQDLPCTVSLGRQDLASVCKSSCCIQPFSDKNQVEWCTPSWLKGTGLSSFEAFGERSCFSQLLLFQTGSVDWQIPLKRLFLQQKGVSMIVSRSSSPL